MKKVDLEVDALERWGEARDHEIGARAAWREAGSPYMHEFSNGMIGLHPLWSAMVMAEKHAEAMRRACLSARAGGRPVGANSAPDRRPGEPPKRVRLRAVGDD